MDAKQIAERQVIERYLAGQLSEAETDAFEAYMESHPEIVREIELITRMKSGLAVLRQRRELGSASRANRLRWPLLVAASVAAVVIAGVLVVANRNTGTRALLVTSASRQLQGENGKPLPLLARISMGRVRGDTEAIAAPPPHAAVELSIDLHAPDSSINYLVELQRVDGAGLRLIGTAPDVVPEQDGSIRVIVRSDALTPGNYLIRVKPPADKAPMEFVLRVVAGSER
jgi:hypothetical protein